MEEELKNLAVLAARELRLGASTDNPHLRALADFLNGLVSNAVLSGTFNIVFWRQVATKVGEDGENMQKDALLRLFAGIAGEMSLLVLGKQQQVPVQHLLRTTLSFCDAMEFENV